MTLQTTAFASSPTAHRCAVKLVRSTSSQLQWAVQAVDISQAPHQPSNLNPKDTVIVTPPPMIRLPRVGKLRPTNRDVSKVAHNRGFLLMRPLCGGRETHQCGGFGHYPIDYEAADSPKWN